MYISLLEGFVKAVVDLDESKALELTRKRLEVGEDPLRVLDDLTKVANIVGEKYEKDEFFIADLVIAGEILKEVILRLRNRSLSIWVFFEGDHLLYVDSLLELPKGWGVAWFERPRDFLKVWEKLKRHTIVIGGVLPALIAGGKPKKIDEYIKNLLKQIKPEGGYILSLSVNELPKDTPLENIRAYINTTLKYGVY